MTTPNEEPAPIGEPERATTFTAFVGDKQIASGDLRAVVSRMKELADRRKADGALLFDDQSGRLVDVVLDGTLEDVLAAAIPEASPKGRGRPKLGVTAREVTLLPRHWDWLEQQPNGASAALRRLVEEARKREPTDPKRLAREATHRFLTAMAGDRPGYEEALRSLYAQDREGFERRARRWPSDIRKHAARLASASF